jgi:hypothetical protein
MQSPRNLGFHHPKRLRILLISTVNVPRHHTGCMLNRVNFRILVHPKVLQIPDQEHVPRHESLQRPNPILGNAGTLDTANRVS